MKLYIGCGPHRLDGYLHVDIDKNVQPDIVATAWELPFAKSGSIDEITSFHMWEHFSQNQCKIALKEWRRVIKRGGKLFIECPNATRSAEMMLSNDTDEKWYGMIGLWGHPYDTLKKKLDDVNIHQVHKWGWSPQDLINLLNEFKFDAKEVPVVQTHRKAYKYKRDMRIEATRR